MLSNNPDLYTKVLKALPSIKFNLIALNKNVYLEDIVRENRYLPSEKNMNIIVKDWFQNISLTQFISYLNDEDVYYEFKETLIQKSTPSLIIDKISEIKSKSIIILLMKGLKIKINSSNINYYVANLSYDSNLEEVVNTNSIIYDEPLGKEVILSTLRGNHLSIKAFTEFWEQYDGIKLNSSEISELDKQQTLILINLDHVNVDLDLINLINKLDIQVTTSFFTHEVKKLILDKKIEVKNRLIELFYEDDILNDQLFFDNINNLPDIEVRKYLKHNNMAEGKFTKILDKKTGYQNLLFENKELFLKVLNWMVDRKYIFSISTTSTNKLKPVFK